MVYFSSCAQDPNDPLLLRAEKLYDCLSEEACPDHVIIDDRTYLSMGARIRDAERLGYPCTVIIGQKVRMCVIVFQPRCHYDLARVKWEGI